MKGKSCGMKKDGKKTKKYASGGGVNIRGCGAATKGKTARGQMA
jgi:hypothetical protein